MSDLSWLNPTPHAIAVYASQPTSPLATQHSLPSGCYSLLGPDFHRLDRTSFVLAHSFDHLVGKGEQRRRHFEVERLVGMERDSWLVSGGCLHWQIGRLLALEDAVDIAGRASILIYTIDTIRYQTARRGIKAFRVDRRQLMPDRKRDNELSKMLRPGARCDQQAARR